jgi:hypothetical protein
MHQKAETHCCASLHFPRLPKGIGAEAGKGVFRKRDQLLADQSVASRLHARVGALMWFRMT